MDLSYLQATIMVLTDRRAVTDAVFLHASSVNSVVIDEQLIELGIMVMTEVGSKCLVINGLPKSECQKMGIPYPGYEIWREIAVRGLSVGSLNVNSVLRPLPASRNTPEESRNLVRMAGELGWDSVTIMTNPHHLLRSMCTIVSVLQETRSSLRVYARTFGDADWTMPAFRTATGGAEPVHGIYFDHIEAEIARIEKYSDKGNKEITPIATPREVVEYLINRDR